MSKIISSQAPGRICLFGDHQDYLKLPIIACAIDRSLRIKGTPNNTNQFVVYKKDLGEEETILIEPSKSPIRKEDFLRTALKVLLKYGCIPSEGYDIIIEGTIPINAGLSSSTALTIAWIQFLVEAFGVDAEVTPEWIAQRAYETEVLEHVTSGGSMDQYTIALGGLIFLKTTDNSVLKLSKPIGHLVVGVSGIAKDTFGSLSHLKGHALKAIEQVKNQIPLFEIAEAKSTDLDLYLKYISPDLLPFFTAAIINHSITNQAKVEFLKANPNPEILGNLMNQHHEQLQRNLKITHPRIDAMINSVLNAGAYGAKIVGSGGGGCIVAMTNKNNTIEIVQSLKEVGAIDAFIVSKAEGSSVKTTSA